MQIVKYTLGLVKKRLSFNSIATYKKTQGETDLLGVGREREVSFLFFMEVIGMPVKAKQL